MPELRAIDPSLVQAATDGDARAVRTILEALRVPLYNLALRILLNPADAEEALQECLLRIVTRLSTFRAEAKFSTWAWQVAVHSILDFRQGMARRARLSFEDFARDLERGLDAHAPERIQDAVYLQQVKVGCSRALLQCLDGDHRVAYILVEILDLDQSEAASICEIAPATFRKRLSRARARIRDHLHQHCGVMRTDAACTCHGRLARAQQLGRLDSADTTDVSVQALRASVRRLDGLAATVRYYAHDGDREPGPELLTRVGEALALG